MELCNALVKMEMKGQGRGSALLLFLTCICCLQLLVAVQGAQHQVGGTPGWSTPPNSKVNYTSWAATQTFAIGDTLYFNYSSLYHNVVQVTEAKYDKCDNSTPIETWDDGATHITLNATGSLYYICGVPGHCDLGQKVAVLVVGSNSTSTAPSAHSPVFALFLISILLFPLLSGSATL